MPVVHFENTACHTTCRQWTDGTDYFARVVSYEHNMFMKYTTGANPIKTFCSMLIYTILKVRLFRDCKQGD